MNRQRWITCISPDLRPGVAAVLDGFAELGILAHFVTTIGFDPSGTLGRALRVLPPAISRGPQQILRRREVPICVAGRVQTYPMREMVRAGFSRLSGLDILSDRLWWWAERSFDGAVAKRWAGVTPFTYGFESASVDTFRAQKRAGGWCVLGQLIAHHRTTLELLRQELEAYPEAATGYELHRLRSAHRVNERKDEQYALSDLIVANSAFVKETFVDAGIPGEKIVVMPGAGPSPAEVLARPRGGEQAGQEERVIFLSAGARSIRKGTPYLLEAWRRLQARNRAELWMVGQDMLPPGLMWNLPGKVRARDTVSRADLFALYRQASVLVLPSLCEGFALVILEAMAHGLPVITTPNSGCGEFVEDGVNGWIIPIRHPDALAERMAWCCENPHVLQEMGRRSREKVARWTWDDYGLAHGKAVLAFMERVLKG